MPRRLNVTDGYAIINTMAAEMFGQNATITAIDESSFVSVGRASFSPVLKMSSILCHWYAAVTWLLSDLMQQNSA